MNIIATPADLADLPAFQRRHGAVYREGEALAGGNTRVTLQAVASLDFYVRVWSGRPHLIQVQPDGSEVDCIALDGTTWTALWSTIVETENRATLYQSGNYYPLSEASVRLYRALVASLEPSI